MIQETIDKYLDTPLKKGIAIAVGVGVGLYVGYRLRVVWIASRFENIAEIAGNQGFADKEFEQMLKDVGFRTGEAWCLTFSKAVWKKAYGMSKTLDSIITKSTIETMNNAKNDKTGTVKWLGIGTIPKAGDIAIWQKNNGSFGHAGIVVKANNKTFITIEGNTNEAGSREGDRVLRKEREYKWDYAPFQLRGFIRKRII